MERHSRGANLDVITDEIYSRFIQSYFTHNHNDFIKFFMYDDVISHAMFCDKIKEFYTEWSSKSRNYDICSDVSVKKYRDFIRRSLNPSAGTYLSMGGGV